MKLFIHLPTSHFKALFNFENSKKFIQRINELGYHYGIDFGEIYQEAVKYEKVHYRGESAINCFFLDCFKQTFKYSWGGTP